MTEASGVLGLAKRAAYWLPSERRKCASTTGSASLGTSLRLGTASLFAGLTRDTHVITEGLLAWERWLMSRGSSSEMHTRRSFSAPTGEGTTAGRALFRGAMGAAFLFADTVSVMQLPLCISNDRQERHSTNNKHF